MTDLSDDSLDALVRLLESSCFALGQWQAPARLYGVLAEPGFVPGGARGEPVWWCIAEGDPYEFLDRLRLDDGVDAVALATTGWATPLGSDGRAHGAVTRTRVRTVVAVTPDGRQCSAIRRQDLGELVVTSDGDGPLLRVLRSLWTPSPGRAA